MDKPANKTIGIIGGMGPLASVDLFRKIVQMTESPDDMGHPRVILDSNTNIPDRTAAILHDGATPLPELVRSALFLERGGADVLVMSCNTAHYYYDEIMHFVRIPFLNMLEETAKEAKAQGFRSVALLSTDGIVHSGVYAKAFLTQGVTLLLPNSDEQQALTAMIYQGVKAGKTVWNTAPITHMLTDLSDQGAQAAILGCTELPLAFSDYHIESALPLLDPTAILAKSALTFVGAVLRPENDSLTISAKKLCPVQQ